MKKLKSSLARWLKRQQTSVERRQSRLKYKAIEFFAPVRRAMRKGRRMEIEVITMMYNEAVLAPLFVRHYAPWVDKFTVFYSESIDGTRRELETASAQCGVKSLNIVPFEFPKGFDDMVKIGHINRAVRKSSADFVICVDADEFVHPWPFDGTNPRDELAKETGEVVLCAMFQSYRHATDADIDRTKPPLFQRRHGEHIVDEHNCLRFIKRCIVRPDGGAQFGVGCHDLVVPQRGSTLWRGVHWGKADDYCVPRYVRDRRDRLSEENRLMGRGVQHFTITGEQLRAELKAHENDPLLF
jgi:hypothetical protein